MALSLTADDSSPLITYFPAGAWIDTPDNDGLRDRYAESSYHQTTTQGATATIQFSGTDIIIVGANRPGYGTYTVAVDGEERMQGNAGILNEPLFKRKLAEITGLSNGPHNVVITSTGAGIDIDSVVFTTAVGQLGTQVPQALYDNNDQNIVYGPSPSVWQSTINGGTKHFGGTLSSSSDPKASASLSFMGEVVAVYATTNANRADMQVALDGQVTTVRGGSGGFTRSEHTKTLMFYAQGLDPSKPHTIVMTSLPQDDAANMTLDGIAVFGAHSQTRIPPPAQASNDGGVAPATTPSNSSAKSKAIIIGASVGGAVGFLLLVGLFIFFYLWWRKRRVSQQRVSMPPVTPIDHLPIQRPDMSVIEAGLGVSRRLGPWTPPAKGSFDHSRSTSMSSTSRTMTPVIKLDIPQPPMSRATSSNSLRAFPPDRPTRPPSLVLPSPS